MFYLNVIKWCGFRSNVTLSQSKPRMMRCEHDTFERKNNLTSRRGVEYPKIRSIDDVEQDVK